MFDEFDRTDPGRCSSRPGRIARRRRRGPSRRTPAGCAGLRSPWSTTRPGARAVPRVLIDPIAIGSGARSRAPGARPACSTTAGTWSVEAVHGGWPGPQPGHVGAGRRGVRRGLPGRIGSVLVHDPNCSPCSTVVGVAVAGDAFDGGDRPVPPDVRRVRTRRTTPVHVAARRRPGPVRRRGSGRTSIAERSAAALVDRPPYARTRRRCRRDAAGPDPMTASPDATAVVPPGLRSSNVTGAGV